MCDRIKTVFEQELTDDQLILSITNTFISTPIIDFNKKNVYVMLNFNEYDEIITISTDINIDSRANYTYKNNFLKIVIFKDKLSNNELKFEHKFVEKKISKNNLRTYPSGKKPAAKDWDKVLKELDVSDEEMSDANGALSKIYKEVDDDTKRAMMKSLDESKGTVLNMNWDEVSKKKVEYLDGK